MKITILVKEAATVLLNSNQCVDPLESRNTHIRPRENTAVTANLRLNDIFRRQI